MKPERLRVSILYGSGQENPDFREAFVGLPNLKFLKQGIDPKTFVTQHKDVTPDLVLVDLDGFSHVPDWLEQIINDLPDSEIMICSQSRDPDFLIRIMKLRVGAFVPLPLQRHDLEEAVARIRAERLQSAGRGHGQIVAVTGTKGGVGTTTVAVNLAVALASELDGGVVLVDLARPFPHVGQFLDLKGTHTVMDLAESPESLDPLFLQKVVQKHNSGLDVLLGQAFHHGSTGHVTDTLSLGKIFSVLQSAYDWVLVDLGTWLDLFHVRMLQRADQVLLVTELTVPDLRDLKIIRALWPDWDLDENAMKVIVNRYVKDYSLGLKDVETVCFQPAFFTLPHDHEILQEAINQGMALGDLAPRSKLWRGFKGLAADLMAERQRQAEKQVAAKPGFLRRLFHKER